MASKKMKILIPSIGIFLVAGGIFMLVYNLYTAQPLFDWLFVTIVILMIGSITLIQGILLLSGHYD